MDVNHYTAAALVVYLDAFDVIAALDESDTNALDETKEIIRQADLKVLPYIPTDERWLDARIARARAVALYYLGPQKPPTTEIAIRVARETLAALKPAISDKELYSGRRFIQFAEAASEYAAQSGGPCPVPRSIIVKIADEAWSQLEAAEDAFAPHPYLPPDEGTFEALFAKAGYSFGTKKTQEPQSPEL